MDNLCSFIRHITFIYLNPLLVFGIFCVRTNILSQNYTFIILRVSVNGYTLNKKGYAKIFFSSNLICAYLAVRNVTFSENSSYVLNR